MHVHGWGLDALAPMLLDPPMHIIIIWEELINYLHHQSNRVLTR